jgi:2-methylisocitrate lyase-like PEP mutase family enzyme
MSETTQCFRAWHVRGAPLVLFNIWDAGSARAVAATGAKAIATSSWSVAAAHGFADGERLPLSLAIDNVRRIVRAVDRPVTVDLEAGYGDVAETIGLAIEAGAIGCNLEDSVPADGRLRNAKEQSERLYLARRTADALLPGFFINARTDASDVGDVIARAHAYRAAGADGIFPPNLTALDPIGRLVEATPLPVNIMIGDATPSVRELAACGVARVSYGPRPYLLAMRALAGA